ncbi:MAG: hypothetical protein ACK502_02440 [Alphaproteobacteria bacterium]
MTHTLHLEYTFQTITLRPALAALHRIEAETGIALTTLAGWAQQGSRNL